MTDGFYINIVQLPNDVLVDVHGVQGGPIRERFDGHAEALDWAKTMARDFGLYIHDTITGRTI